MLTISFAAEHDKKDQGAEKDAPRVTGDEA
jgi:hypothetical protein